MGLVCLFKDVVLNIQSNIIKDFKQVIKQSG